MFKVNIDNAETAVDLKKKEFSRGHGLAGRFVSWEDLATPDAPGQLETWSLAVLNGINDIRGLRKAV